MSEIFEGIVHCLFALIFGEHSLQTKLGIVALTVALAVLFGAFILSATAAVSPLLLWSITIPLDLLLFGAAWYLLSGSDT